MRRLVCNTSPLQYLHQIELLDVLSALAEEVLVPRAVVRELEAGTALGVALPELSSRNWVCVRNPASELTLPLVTDLGAGEREVLALALETPDAVAVLDDGLARRAAESLQIPLTGTLGLLVDAKRAGIVSAVAPLLDRLRSLRFHLAPRTREAVLKLAGED